MGGSTAKSNTKREQTQAQNATPPIWAQPLFTQGAKDALELYRSGQGGNAYSGQRVADLSDTTKTAIAGLNNSTSAFDSPALQGVINQPTQAARNLENIATGAMVGGNAVFNKAMQNTLDNAATTINSRLSGAGRYGSGAHNKILADNLGQIAAHQTADQYNRDVQHMLAANAQIDSANQGQLNGAGNFLNRQGESYARALSGGRVLDAANQAQFDAQRQYAQERDNEDWNRLALLQAAANGFAAPYGTTTTQNETRTRQNPGLLDTISGIGRLAGKSR